MTPAAKPYHEPEENDAQIGTLLDAMVDTLDHTIEQAVRHGLEAKVREIVAKRLQTPLRADPPPSPPAPAAQPVASSLAAGLKGCSPEQIDKLIGLLNCVQVFDEHVRRTKADSPSGKRAASCRDFLRAEIEKLKGAAK